MRWSRASRGRIDNQRAPAQADHPSRNRRLLLRRHNLNLLPILRELLRTRSVSRTAEIVGLSQSAVSAALARLRETYNDDLLVMVGRRLELTEKGAQLIEPTERACLEVEGLLRPSQLRLSSRLTAEADLPMASAICFCWRPAFFMRCMMHLCSSVIWLILATDWTPAQG